MADGHPADKRQFIPWGIAIRAAHPGDPVVQRDSAM
jgi:hypothetical protein